MLHPCLKLDWSWRGVLLMFVNSLNGYVLTLAVCLTLKELLIGLALLLIILNTAAIYNRHWLRLVIIISLRMLAFSLMNIKQLLKCWTPLSLNLSGFMVIHSRILIAILVDNHFYSIRLPLPGLLMLTANR